MIAPLLAIRNLTVQFRVDSGWVTAIDDVSLDVDAGDCVGVVGESGSGKSVTALSILRLHARATTRMPSGTILYQGQDLLRARASAMRRIRGSEIAMIFQDPMSSLNPVLTIADQISETLRQHQGLTGAAARKRVVELLGLVRIPDAARRADDYPHRLSGGMRQRVMIAMAIACKPRLLIADEPTTALDVTIQAQILELLRDLRKELEHVGDADLARSRRDRRIRPARRRDVCRPRGRGCAGGAAVPAAGASVHHGADRRGAEAGQRCAAPCHHSRPHPVTAGGDPGLPLQPALRAGAGRLPGRAAGHAAGRRSPVGALSAAASCTGRAPWLISPGPSSKSATSCKTFAVKHAGGVSTLHALSGVNFDIMRGETLGLVGESGSGKTTAGRILVGLIPATSGTVSLFGHSITGPDGKAQLAAVRSRLQFVFQDPYASLNPRMRIGNAIAEPLDIAGTHSRKDRNDRVAELLELVGLPQNSVERYPHEFSGGQRQRIVIARALALNPDFVVCDEPVSALDVSMQAQIVNLLLDLQDRLGLSYLFIAHDLAVVRAVSTRVAVMYAGAIVETAPKAQIYSDPQHPYSRALLDAVPRADPDFVRHPVVAGEVPSLLDPPSGCRFHPRCAFAMERCRVEVPLLKEFGADRRVACHLFST